MSSEYIVREKKFEKEVLEHLKKKYGKHTTSDPLGKRDVDIGILRPSVKVVPNRRYENYEVEIFVEVKGTQKPNGERFTSNQNKGSHLPVGLFQLMRRIQGENQRGMLFLPYHPDFVKSLNEAQVTLKKTELEIWFCNKNGRRRFWRWKGSNR
jgi:hypothetical protein